MGRMKRNPSHVVVAVVVVVVVVVGGVLFLALGSSDQRSNE